MIVIILSPLVSAYVGHLSELPTQSHFVTTNIDIDPAPEEFWKHIIRAPKITEPLEVFLYDGVFQRLLPQRYLTKILMEFEPHLFERGLTFIETMDVWAPQKISLLIIPDQKT